MDRFLFGPGSRIRYAVIAFHWLKLRAAAEKLLAHSSHRLKSQLVDPIGCNPDLLSSVPNISVPAHPSVGADERNYLFMDGNYGIPFYQGYH